MKPTRLLAFVWAGSVAGTVPLAIAEGPATQPAEPVSVQQPGQVDVMIQRIREAQDPSSAIQAYTDARAAAPADLAPLKAYVHRMTELGLPEMVDLQAQDLLKRAPEDGVAWAVVGYLAAKRDQMDAAATDLAAAVRLSPDDAFVQRTAGQIVAWADTRPDKAVISAETRVAIDAMRTKLGGKPAYAQAYQGAVTGYQRLASAPAPAAQGPTTAPAPTPAPTAAGPSDDTMFQKPYAQGEPPTYYYPPTYTYPDYPIYQAPYYSSAYAAPYWYPGGFYGYGSSWWWPTASSVIIIDQNCRNQFAHHHGHGDFHGQGDVFRDPRFFDHGHGQGDLSGQRGGHVLMQPAGHGRDGSAAPVRVDARGMQPGGFGSAHLAAPAPARSLSSADHPSGQVVRVDPQPQRLQMMPAPAPQAMAPPRGFAAPSAPPARMTMAPMPAPARSGGDGLVGGGGRSASRSSDAGPRSDGGSGIMSPSMGGGGRGHR